jgi:hypothetical protein
VTTGSSPAGTSSGVEFVKLVVVPGQPGPGGATAQEAAVNPKATPATTARQNTSLRKPVRPVILFI